MKLASNTTCNQNEFLHRLLTLEKEKSAQEILDEILTEKPQLSPIDSLAELLGNETEL